MSETNVKSFHLHLVSDSTGETVGLVARACLVQFDTIEATEHLWAMIRSKDQVEDLLSGISKNPGFVLYTIVNEDEITYCTNGSEVLVIKGGVFQGN